jgi:hypothetical protein
MKRLYSAKPLIAAAIALGALGAASMAQAHETVRFSVAVSEPAYDQPAPVYYGRYQTAPVYYGRYQTAPVYYRHDRAGPFGDSDHDGIQNRFDRDSRFFDRRAARNVRWADTDHDGVPDRFDRAPYNPRRY